MTRELETTTATGTAQGIAQGIEAQGIEAHGAEGAEAVASARMFSHFDEARRTRLPRWAAPLLGAAAAVHVVVFAAMWAKTIWDVEQLERSKSRFDLALAPPPPPPPPPAKAGAKPVDVDVKPRQRKVTDMVQPVKLDKPQDTAPATDGDPTGVEGSDGNGEPGGVGDAPFVAAPPPPPPPPPAPPAPAAVKPQVLEQQRIAGEHNIIPDDVTRGEIARSGQDRLSGTFSLCVSAGGEVSGLVSGGCLERDLAERARALSAAEPVQLVTYDLRDDAEIDFGLGFGCKGKLTILLERIDPSDPTNVCEHLDALWHSAEPRSAVCALILDGAQLGARLWHCEDRVCRVKIGDSPLAQVLARACVDVRSGGRSRS